MSDPNKKPSELSDDTPRDLTIPNKPITRSQTKTKTQNSDNSDSLNNFKSSKMANTGVSIETLIGLIPRFEGTNRGEIYRFFNACDFAMQNVDSVLKPVLLQAIQTKLSGKAFAITQNRVITDWPGLRSLLEGAFCAQRTPGYLQLELNSSRQKSGEAVQDYATRVENLIHELCNVSVVGKSKEATEAIRDYIRETTLTTYVEGLDQNLRQIIKSRNHKSIEDAIKDSLEEEKLLKSSLETQRLLQNVGSSKYCSICRRSNHNTNQCRSAKEKHKTQDTGQNDSTQRAGESTTQKVTCSYCKLKGHTKEVCFKKKKADSRQQSSFSGNESKPDATGDRSVRDLKIIAQH